MGGETGDREDKGAALKKVSDDGGSSGSFFNMVRRDQAPATSGNSTHAISQESDDNQTGLAAEAVSADGLPDEPADNSDMPHDARRVLVHLMRQGAIVAGQKPKLFESICRYEALVRRHLSEVYLRLVLDQKAGVALVARQENDPGEEDEASDIEFVSLISRRTLSLYDTLLLLVLRRHYQEREASGEQKVTVDVERLESYLTPFLPLTNHAKADRKKLNGAIQKFVQKKVLAAIRGSDDRYEITPIIRYVVDAAFLESMLADYLRLASESGLSLKPTETDSTAQKNPADNQTDLLGGL